MNEEKVTSLVGDICDIDKILDAHFKLDTCFKAALKLGTLVEYEDEFFIGDGTIVIMYTVKKPLL